MQRLFCSAYIQHKSAEDWQQHEGLANDVIPGALRLLAGPCSIQFETGSDNQEASPSASPIASVILGNTDAR